MIPRANIERNTMRYHHSGTTDVVQERNEDTAKEIYLDGIET